MPCSVVCISRPDGAGGASIGHLAAERLGFDYVDEAIVSSAAAKGRISADDVADAEKRKPPPSSVSAGRTAGPGSYGFAGLSDPSIEGITPKSFGA